MPSAKLSRSGIAEIKPNRKRTTYYDVDLAGFALRVEPTGRSTYFVEYRPGAGGRNVAKKRFTIGSTGEFKPDRAREEARKLLAEIRLGSDPAAHRARSRATPTLVTFARAHLDAMAEIAREHPEQASLREGTIRSYRSLLKKHLVPAFGGRQLDVIGKDEVKRLHNHLGKTSPTTANRCVEFVGSIFRAAAEAGHVNEGINPARGIRAFKERRRERFLSADELARLGAAIRIAETTGIPYEPPYRSGKKAKHVPKLLAPTIVDQHTAAALRLLIFSGARLREILHAKWADLDVARGLLGVFGKTGKRHIVLPAPALEVIACLPRTSGRYLIASSDPTKPKADINRPWRGIRRMADLEDLRLHDLRHSFASVAVSGGASLPMIGKLLGHSQPQTTMRYSHLSDNPLRTAAETTAGTIAAAMNSSRGTVVSILRDSDAA